MSDPTLWQTSGTKILGYSAAAVGAAAAAVASIDPTLITAVIGPKYGAYIALAMAIFGGFTAKRGHKNTADIAAEQNAQMSSPSMPTMTTNVGRSPP